MALLKKLKSLLGLEDESQPESSRDVGVTVEKERQAVDAEPTDAEPTADESTDAKPTDEGATTDSDTLSTAVDTEDESVEEAEPSDGETSADESVDGEIAGDDPAAEATEVTEADRQTVDESEPETTEAESDAAVTEAEAEPETADEAEPAAAEDEASSAPTEEDDSGPVQDIKGIGPAYADRLGAAGVETIADLAAADPDAIAEETDISATRVDEWVKRAKTRL